MTGLQPYHHGVRNNGYYVFDKQVPTLASILKENNYATAAFVSSYVLDSRFGLNYGFDDYDDDVEKNPKNPHHMAAERRAEPVTERVLQWLEKNSSRRFFMWLHYYDPHDPYSPPAFYKETFDDPYDGEIAYVDYQFGRIINYLKKANLSKDTLIIIVGDHGEAFGEHEEIEHGIFLYDATIHVPLLIHFPNFFPSREIDSLVRTTDIFSTVLELAGIKHYVNDGASLVPFFVQEDYKTDISNYAETLYPSTFRWASFFSLRTLKWKFIDAPIPELYNLTNDPGENNNVINSYPETAEKFRRTLVQILNEQKSTQLQFIDKQSQDKLISLGYTGTSLHMVKDNNLPDPKLKISYWNVMQKAQKMLLKEPARAIEILQKLHEKDADTPTYAYYLAAFYKKAKQWDKAQFYIEEAIKRDNQNYVYWHDSAYYAALLNQIEQAKEAIETCLKLNPAYPDAYNLRGSLLMKANRMQDALNDFNKVIELDEKNSEAYSKIGNIFFMTKDYQKAEAYYQKALQHDEKRTDALNGIGALMLQQKRYQAAIEYFKRALKNEPTFYEAYINLAIGYISMGNYSEARYYLETLLKEISKERQGKLYNVASEILKKLPG
ncbi:MAG: hypothetical protein A2Y62_05460 [Candidatus Fischerbacteria bacterium RBG_13_37_8]|uniref:Sulfatase N-terminal domain-containing protein n=1 Tax=Candidatus Fischerbacteria bacterium RBG_13_37_8 TaxID=1817863 RepID=A0A1F5VY01_9BACT|nr:MAG: hypothetical protein A2Y62_05460 [Candidatus Fischerbacteria bacterium RBG_13_37_8]